MGNYLSGSFNYNYFISQLNWRYWLNVVIYSICEGIVLRCKSLIEEKKIPFNQIIFVSKHMLINKNNLIKRKHFQVVSRMYDFWKKWRVLDKQKWTPLKRMQHCNNVSLGGTSSSLKCQKGIQKDWSNYWNCFGSAMLFCDWMLDYVLLVLLKSVKFGFLIEGSDE